MNACIKIIATHKKTNKIGLILLKRPLRFPLKYPVIEYIKGDKPKKAATPVKSTKTPIKKPEMIPNVLPYFIDQYKTRTIKKSGRILFISKVSINNNSIIQTKKL